jgi:WD40 repeat protein
LARLFISHSSSNNAAAFALRDWLAEQGFADVFLDVDPGRGLVAGERWQEALKAAADRCEAVLFLVSAAWLDSKWCLAEFLLAKTLHKRIFGLLVEPVPLDRIPVEMTAEWQICELAGGSPARSFEVTVGAAREQVAFREAGLELLRRGLDRAGLDPKSFPWPPPRDLDRAPYRGLRALEPEDAAVFFGREAMIVRGLDSLRGMAEGGVDKLMVVLGASGSGKSSFLRAGLLPRLARDDLMFLPLPVIRPETAPISGGSGLALALVGAAAKLGAQHTPGRVKEMIGKGPGEVARFLAELAGLARRRLVHVDQAVGPTVVISIDQAEELFNPDGAEEAAQLLALLVDLLAPSNAAIAPRVIVLVTIRSDRYEQLQSQAAFADVKRVLFDLPPIPSGEFKSVIEGPAARVVEAGGRLAIDPALTERLIADAAGADALPLLSFTLERLYADYGGEGRLTLAEYTKLGGVQGSLEAAVAQAFADPGRAPAIPAAKEDQLARLRAAFIPWLARVAPDTGTPMRRVARREEIPQSSAAMVERLVAARLLVADRRGGVDVVEVAHESLLRRWPALASWLEADAADLKVVEGVERAAGEWDRNDRHDAWLDHRAERLLVAERLTSREDFHRRLGEEGNAYLAACRTREEAERREKEEALAREQARLKEIAVAQARTARNQKVARWSLGLAGLAVLAGFAGGLWQRYTNGIQQAKQQTRTFVELARIERKNGNRDAVLRFAVDAARIDPDQQKAGATLSGNELTTSLQQAGWRLILGGHELSVASAEFSPDAKRIVTVSKDKTARLWDAATGRELQVLRGHEAPLWTGVFSPDGSRILTASEDKTARIWDAATGAQIAVLRGHQDRVTDARFSPDGSRIVTSSFDKTARIWDAATANQISVLEGHENTVQTAEFSPDGSRIVTASDDTTARIWDASTAQQIATLRGHTKSVYAASFSPDGSRIVTGSNDDTARVWDAASAREIMKPLEGHTDYVNCALFSPDGSQILTTSADHTAAIWDAASGARIRVLLGHENFVNCASYSPNGKLIATASSDRTVRLWDAVPTDAPALLRGHGDGVRSAEFSPDGTRIVTASQDKTAWLWNIASGGQPMVLSGHEAPLWTAEFSPDGTKIVTASEDKTARLWDAATGKQSAVLQGHENWVLDAAFSRDGKRIVTASWDTTARIWDAATGQQLVKLSHPDIVRSAAFSPDGTRVVTASRDHNVRIWDATTGAQIALLSGHEDDVTSAAFNSDGSRILSASADRTARLWDAKTAKEILRFQGDEDGLNRAAFSPDGKRVVTASQDHTARIWDSVTAREIAVLSEDNVVQFADFSPDGTKVVTASQDRMARIWNAVQSEASVTELIVEACRRLGPESNLTSTDIELALVDTNSTAVLHPCQGIK